VLKKGMEWRKGRKNLNGSCRTWVKNYSGMSYDTAHRYEVIHDFLEDYKVFYRASVSYNSLGKKIPALRAFFKENPDEAPKWMIN
jgi:acetone carboxylase gamma subunit